MIALQLIAKLIDFPTEELATHQAEVCDLITHCSDFTDEHKAGLIAFINGRCGGDLLDWQSEYDSLFERGRSLSLFVFEHTHGESRDRGQAMVDLLAKYREAGLELSERELPDFIPVYLEFASTQGLNNARDWLEDIGAVLAVLATRLRKRDSDYAVLFETLLEMVGIEFDRSALAAQVDNEERDDTPEKLDQVWEEEMVTFGAGTDQEGCGTATNRPSPGQRRDHEQPLNLANFSAPSA